LRISFKNTLNWLIFFCNKNLTILFKPSYYDKKGEQMESGRLAWLRYRKGGIGSSDAPVVMGVSPWKTQLELYHDKISEEIVEKTSFITEKGNRFEPKIRALYETTVNKSFPPALMQMAEFDFMRASLDGQSEDKKEIVEIKLVGKADFMEAQGGTIPAKYYPQVQHQLMVSGAEKCQFLAYEDCDKGVMLLQNLAVVTERPDLKYQYQLMDKCIEFWEHVTNRIPPNPTESDYHNLRGVTKEFNRLKIVKRKIIELEAEYDTLQDTIFDAAEACGKGLVCLSGVKISKTNGKWRIEI
jgi:putative phage-type endonuclease